LGEESTRRNWRGPLTFGVHRSADSKGQETDTFLLRPFAFLSLRVWSLIRYLQSRG